MQRERGVLVKMTAEEMDNIKAAAEYYGLPLVSFIRMAALTHARQVLRWVDERKFKRD